MISRLLGRLLRRFETRYAYDASYLRDIVSADAAGGVKLMLAASYLSHRAGIPAAAYFAAKIRSAKSADCGACLALVIAMAEEAGVGAETVLAALGEADADPSIERVIAYADAVIANAPELPAIVDEARSAFGERGLAGLASAVVAGQFYPLLKRGMGHAQACAPVIRDYVRGHAGGRHARSGEMEERAVG